MLNLTFVIRMLMLKWWSLFHKILTNGFSSFTDQFMKSKGNVWIGYCYDFADSAPLIRVFCQRIEWWHNEPQKGFFKALHCCDAPSHFDASLSLFFWFWGLFSFVIVKVINALNSNYSTVNIEDNIPFHYSAQKVARDQIEWVILLLFLARSISSVNYYSLSAIF